MLGWYRQGEILLGPKIVLIISNKVNVIREKIKITQDRQKSYVDNRRKNLEFEVGDMVFLKVTPWKEVIRFGRWGKLGPRYTGLYEIIERIEPVTYRLALLEELSRSHNVFHVSMLQKYIFRSFTYIDGLVYGNWEKFALWKAIGWDFG